MYHENDFVSWFSVHACDVADPFFRRLFRRDERAGGDTAVQTEALTDASEETAYAPLPQTRLNGFAFRFLNNDDSWLTWAVNPLDADELNGDVLNDAIWNRNNRIEETYGCTITETTLPRPQDHIASLVQSGDVGAEVVMLYDETVMDRYISGYILTWEILPYIDFTESCWSLDATETFSAAGKVYAATGSFSLAQTTRSFIQLYNKDLYKDLGLKDDLYQLVREGKWTMDAMLKASVAAVADLNGDGVMDLKNDRFGNCSAVKLYYGALVSGAGVKYVDLDEKGEVKFALLGNEYALGVLSDILNKHAGNYAFIRPVNDIHNGGDSKNMFFNNQLLFKGIALKAVSNYREMESDIGILPFPKYSEEQERYYSLTSGGTMATLPKTLPQTSFENVGLILEALTRDSEESVVPVYKETLLKSRYARDQGSADMLDIIFTSAMYDIGLCVMPGETYYKYMEVFYSGTDTFASLTQSIAESVNVKLEMLSQVE